MCDSTLFWCLSQYGTSKNKYWLISFLEPLFRLELFCKWFWFFYCVREFRSHDANIMMPNKCLHVYQYIFHFYGHSSCLCLFPVFSTFQIKWNSVQAKSQVFLCVIIAKLNSKAAATLAIFPNLSKQSLKLSPFISIKGAFVINSILCLVSVILLIQENRFISILYAFHHCQFNWYRALQVLLFYAYWASFKPPLKTCSEHKLLNANKSVIQKDGLESTGVSVETRVLSCNSMVLEPKLASEGLT